MFDSLAVRRTEGAIELLANSVDQSDRATQSGAIRALGRFGNRSAATHLIRLLATNDTALRAEVGAAGLICSERCVAEQDLDAVRQLLKAIRQADVPLATRHSATYSLILASPTDRDPLLDGLLSAQDNDGFRFGLAAARQLGAAATPQVRAALGHSSPGRQALLAQVLSDTAGESAIPALLELAADGPDEPRAVALEALGRLHVESALATLIGALGDANPNVVAAAANGLAQLPPGDTDRTILALLETDDSQQQLAAVELLGRRRCQVAVPALLRLGDCDKPTVRQAAIRSLGSTIGVAQLGPLLQRLQSAADPEEKAVVQEAIQTACQRLPDQACVDTLARVSRDAPPEVRLARLEVIATIGTEPALQAIVLAAQDPEDAIQDAATRLLGQWSTADAAEPLLRLASTMTDPRYRVRSLRGYLRFARQFDFSPAAKAEMCLRALEIAERDEERLLVIETLSTLGTVPALQVVVPLLDEEPLRESAARAILMLAASTMSQDGAATRTALQRVIRATRDGEIARQATALLTRPAPQLPE